MKVSIYAMVGLAIVSAVLGIGFGYYLTPEYRATMYERNSMDLGRADRTFDLRYINEMISHHRGAMLLAEQLGANTSRPEMKDLAQNILKDEPAAIDELYAWKKAWYGDSRRVRDPIVANLGPGDEKFDLRFLNAIIAHHEAGIMMTRETRQKSSRVEVLNNADAVEAFLTNGLVTLNTLRKSWYAVPYYASESMYTTDTMDLGIADKNIDLRYIDKMAAHHRGAILLALQIGKESKRKEIQDLAVAIQAGEPPLIEELYTWKKAWYQDERKIADPIVAQLGTYDEKIDLRFLNALIAHHQAGIEMTKEIRTKSSRKEVLDNADAVEAFLTNGIETLKKLRKDWYNL